MDSATAQGLRVLRKRIAQCDVPGSCLDQSLNVATWNIRAFGKSERSEKSLHYIAEVISCFDLVAVVELASDVDDLQRVLAILGPYWDAIFSAYVTDPGGNSERINALHARNLARQQQLDHMNTWRNAIAHQDWTKVGPELRLATVQGWRSNCAALARAFDVAVGNHLAGLVGNRPW